jgi:hypothetical protein
MSTQFKRQTDLKRSSGLRLSTPVRSLVERVAASAGLTYSDAIRLLVEEALAARAGERDNLAGRITRAEKAIVESLRGQAQALSTIEQEALVRTEQKIARIERILEYQWGPYPPEVG